LAASAREGECRYTALGSLHCLEAQPGHNQRNAELATPVTARYSPPSRAPAEIHVQVQPKDRGHSVLGTCTPTTARPHVRRHARRHRTCAATMPRPRSTPGRGVTHDLARRGADLRLLRYHLTVPPRPSPLVLSQAHHWAAAGPVLGPPPVHLKARSGSTNEHSVCTGSGHGSIAPSSSSPSAQRTRRSHAGEPVPGPASAPLATALIRPSRRDG